jgi:hypothetical protein
MPALVPGPACPAVARATIHGGHARACSTAVTHLHTAVHRLRVTSQLLRTIHDDIDNPARETLARCARAAPCPGNPQFRSAYRLPACRNYLR